MNGNQWTEHLRVADTAARAGEEARAWELLQPLLNHWRQDIEAARHLAVALTIDELARDRRLALADELLSARAEDPQVPRILGNSAETFLDLRYLNDAPPEHQFFARLLETLARHFDTAKTDELRAADGAALATVARVLGRQADLLCDRVHQELLRIRPLRWQDHYNYGLFLKTRGRFADGVRANLRARELDEATDEGVTWNLGICATGAGQGDLALRTWKETLGFVGELGPDGLPAGTFHHVKVRVAKRPLAHREARSDTPGDEETLWVERLSPCHGRILSPPVAGVGVEYGDVILFDGAPITSHDVEGRSVPVFPHLATLRRGNWRVYAFAGRQGRQREIAEFSASLPGDSVLYPHTEQVRFFCKECWEGGATAPGHSHEVQAKHAIVQGKFCVDPTVSLAEVDQVLTRLLCEHPDTIVVSPAFSRAVGNEKRARAEDALFAELMTQVAATR